MDSFRMPASSEMQNASLEEAARLMLDENFQIPDDESIFTLNSFTTVVVPANANDKHNSNVFVAKDEEQTSRVLEQVDLILSLDQENSKNSDASDTFREEEDGEIAVDDDDDDNSVNRKTCLKTGFVLCFGLFVSLAIIFGVLGGTIWRKREGRRDVSTSNSLVTQDASSFDATITTPAPSLSPTPSPTLSPTPSPSVDNLLNLLRQISSPESLQENTTPQTRAHSSISSYLSNSQMLPSDKEILQRYALLVLFYSTGNSLWSKSDGWKSQDSHECTWTGIQCTVLQDGTRAVVSITLRNNWLVGPIPSELCVLGSSLEEMDLSINLLHGTIPSCLGSNQMAVLQRLSLADNVLNGPVPVGILSNNVPNLELLRLGGNRLSGALQPLFGEEEDETSSIPSFNTRLVELTLDRNKFSGTLSSSFSRLSRLESFVLDRNNITGSVPRSICDSANKFGTLIEFIVDCDKLECRCCTNCS